MIPFAISAIEDESDRTFMTELYMNYERLLYSEIRKLLSNTWEIEDVFQTTLVKLIDRLPVLKTLDERPLVNYIITAAKNNARSVQRLSPKVSKTTSIDEAWSGKEDISDGVSAEDVLLRVERVRNLESIWPLLSEKNRSLLEYKYILGYENEEIAAEMGIKPDSVRMELSRARKQAKTLLLEQFDEADI